MTEETNEEALNHNELNDLHEAIELNNANDKAFKGTFGMPEVTQEYLINCFDKKLTAKLDFSTLKKLPTSYITPQLQEYFSDLVWQCETKGGMKMQITFLFEHKSYLPKVPQIQLLMYLASGYMEQLNNDEDLTLIVPIIVYHGEAKWHYKPFKDYFKNFDDDFAIFLPLFDYWLTDLQKYPDATIKRFEAGFLPKIFLAFKHYRDKNYIKDEFVSLLMFDTSDASNIDKIKYFFQVLTLYLCHLSDIGDDEFKEKMEKFSEPLKSEAMTTYKRIVNKGVEQGRELEKEENVKNAFLEGYKVEEIAAFLKIPMDKVKTIIEKYQKSQGHAS
jgi:predicted transposase/invertase (TIGR01784 family)